MISEAVAATLWPWGKSMERAWIHENVTRQLHPLWTEYFQTLCQVNDKYSLLYFKPMLSNLF